MTSENEARADEQETVPERGIDVPTESTDAADATAEEPSFEERVRAAIPNVTRWLVGTKLPDPADALRQAADETAELDRPEEWDRYATRGPVAALEEKVKDLLGKPAAAMFPSGIMAQQSALRVWSDRQGSRRIAIPSLSHLLMYEQDGPLLLNGFEYELLSVGARVPGVSDLDAIPGRLGAALLELPLREGAYLLPTWDELVEFSQAARTRGVPLHFDGARLWEAQPYLGHSLAEIADLADTVYVSFYKGLGGMAGAALAGPEDVIEEARAWRKRHGGTIFGMTAYALSGLRGLRLQLPHMQACYERAVALAAVFEGKGLRVHPNPPHTNAFRIYLDEPVEVVNERILASLENDLVVLLPPMNPGQMPGTAWTEFTVGTSTLEWEIDEAAEAVGKLLGRG